jgi:integrase
VLGLRWQDVNLDSTGGGTVSIRFQLQRVHGKLQLTLPKSESSQRTIYLPLPVADALRKRREIEEQERLLSGARWNNLFDLVFTNRDGGPLDPSRVRKRFKKVIAESSTTDLRLHDLRHIAASHLLGEGISVADTAANLGHADPYLVVRTYGHAMPQGKRQAAEAMERAFSKPKIP